MNNKNPQDSEFEIVLDTFHIFLEALEEYIGKLDHYKN